MDAEPIVTEAYFVHNRSHMAHWSKMIYILALSNINKMIRELQFQVSMIEDFLTYYLKFY